MLSRLHTDYKDIATPCTSISSYEGYFDAVANGVIMWQTDETSKRLGDVLIYWVKVNEMKCRFKVILAICLRDHSP